MSDTMPLLTSIKQSQLFARLLHKNAWKTIKSRQFLYNICLLFGLFFIIWFYFGCQDNDNTQMPDYFNVKVGENKVSGV
jgi:hypothetical protein